MPLRIIHCADFHLDSVFSELPGRSEALKRCEDLRGTLGKIINLTKAENADMLIISGDLFDSENVSRHTLKYIADKLSSVPELPVYICAGNHDPKTEDSCYKDLETIPNVYVFDTKMECVEGENVDIYGISFDSLYAQGSYLEEFTVKNPEKINIMIMHGDFSNPDYNLITKTQMLKSGIDYMALGHIHKHDIIVSGRCMAVYPGCPEGRGFDETGDKGVVCAEISKGKIKIRFVPVCRRRYHELLVDVTGLYSYEDICAKIQANGNLCADDLYKIVLTGVDQFDIEEDVVKDNLNAFMIKVVKKTSQAVNLKEEASEFSLRGLFIKKALREIEKEDEETIRLALDIGLEALKGR